MIYRSHVIIYIVVYEHHIITEVQFFYSPNSIRQVSRRLSFYYNLFPQLLSDTVPLGNFQSGQGISISQIVYPLRFNHASNFVTQHTERMLQVEMCH